MAETVGRCIVCGAPTTGQRCRRHNYEHQSLQWLIDTQARDREVLDLVAQGVIGLRLAIRLGISRTRASQRVRVAREREARRQQLSVATE